MPTAGGFVQKAKTVTKRKAKEDHTKKKCHLGSKCPYKEEYQHQLEFSHDLEPLNNARWGTNNTNHVSSGSDVFKGKGQKLGGGNGLGVRIGERTAIAGGGTTTAALDDFDGAGEGIPSNTNGNGVFSGRRYVVGGGSSSHGSGGSGGRGVGRVAAFTPTPTSSSSYSCTGNSATTTIAPAAANNSFDTDLERAILESLLENNGKLGGDGRGRVVDSSAGASATASAAASSSALAREALQPALVAEKTRHIFIDNSNIYIGAQTYDRSNGARKPNLLSNKVGGVRLNIPGLVNLVSKTPSKVGKKVVVGSNNSQAGHRIWQHYESCGFTVKVQAHKGKEDMVDEFLHAQAYQCILEGSKDAFGTHTLVLLTGDGNRNSGYSSFIKVVELAAQAGWRVEVWAWGHGLSTHFINSMEKYPDGRISVYFLDDHADEVIVTPEGYTSNMPGSGDKAIVQGSISISSSSSNNSSSNLQYENNDDKFDQELQRAIEESKKLVTQPPPPLLKKQRREGTQRAEMDWRINTNNTTSCSSTGSTTSVKDPVVLSAFSAGGTAATAAADRPIVGPTSTNSNSIIDVIDLTCSPE